MKYNFDAPQLTRDEATELCVYHLRMATALFQLVPDDGNVALYSEINRQCKGGIDAIDVLPTLAWAKNMLEAYTSMKQYD